MTGRIWTTAALSATLLAGGCDDTKRPRIEKGWVRLAANPDAPAAAYFTITGGTKSATLTGISTALVKRAELHNNIAMAHGMTGMAPLANVDIPIGLTVNFTPGGKHVMLFGVDPSVHPGDRLTTSFAFAGRPAITTPLKVVGPGDPAPY